MSEAIIIKEKRKVSAPWILCVLLFVVILYLVTCKTKTATVPKSEYEALKKTTQDTVKYFNEILKADDAAIVTATAHAVQSAERAIESEAKVTEGQSIIARLNAKLNAARNQRPDSSFVTVSPEYVIGCDSLQLQSEYQDIQINRMKKDNAVLVAAKEQEIATRDNKLIDQENFNIALRKQLDTCQLKVKEKENVKVKNQWYGVVGLTGNEANPLGGGEAGIILINKKGVLYGIKGEIVGGRVWYGVKTGVRLFR